jgi:amino acid adenylation domain-containing protein
MSETPEQLTAFSPDRQELLEMLLREQSEDANVFPLSYAQRRLWFLNQLEPSSPAYNISTAVHLRGALNLNTFERSLNEVVRRHEALRTTFVLEGDRPVQRIAPALTVALPLVDLSNCAADMRAAETARLMREEARRPFDLARGPLLRAAVLRLSEREHVALITMHHIVSDGWSMGVLIREMATLYAAFSAGQPSPLAELPIQYADFAEWEHDYLRGDSIKEQLDYWQRQLGGTLPVLQLPTDRPRQTAHTARGARQRVALPKELSDALKALSQREGATLFMTLLAAFQTLLWRYTGQEDITTGSSVAGRNRSQIEGLIGFFLNTLVLRTDLGGQPTFRELLRRVREVALDAYSNQDVPVEMLIEALQPDRTLHHNPLFQVLFVFQNTPPLELKMGALELLPETLETGTAKFDLLLDLTDGAEGINGWLEYSLDLFDAETIARMTGHFQTLLENAVAAPDAPLADLSLLTDEAQRQLLTAVAGPRVAGATGLCLHEMFEAQAARTPNACALVCDGARLSYRELNERANQLAHRLRALGVRPETPVGIYTERAPEMIVGLLGSLKAGGFYVPLDTAYPPERLAFVLADAGVEVLLTQARLSDKLPAGTGLKIIRLDADADALAREAKDNPAPIVAPDNLAYMIYTSGSTGQPKGVKVQHSSVVNYVAAACATYALCPDDRVLQFASVSFDASAEEIYPCLATGATLVLRSDAMLGSAALFFEKCREWDISVLNLPTAYWHELTGRFGTEIHALPSRIRLVIIGGERALPERLALWQKFVGRDVRLMNTYGPTEATIVATACDLSAHGDELTGRRELPIGRAVRNTQAYVLDRSLNLVPVGVPGELYIGGAGLARCYHDRPALTAERFIPHPFSSEPGARLYKTGDLARYLADGEIEYLGRGDAQVKVRGYRIEPGEIEAVLAQHAAVVDAVVVARADAPGEQQLVAYVVLKREASATAAQLRGFVKEKLPAYMIPAWFVLLDALPLTVSGKVDRHALPAPQRVAGETDAVFVAPRNQIEELVARVWADVLGLERVGAEDNFFELGGHSLLATQVISRIREALQIELALHTIFESPTAAGLAVVIEETMRAGQRLQRPALRPVPRNQELPLSFAQERLWFLNQLDPDSAAYHVLRPLRITGRLNVELMERTLTEVMRRHEVYRTVFPAVDGRAVQVINEPQAVSIPVVDLRAWPVAEREAEAMRRVQAEGLRLFDLARGPLWRLLLLQLDEEDHLLVLTEHHMVHDGWTEGALVRDFLTLYAAFAAGEPSPLAPLPVQYADFAYWQRQWLQGETLETLLAYWKEHLKDAPPVLMLPTDRPRPAVQTFRGAVATFAFTPELTQAINALNRQEGVTMFMLLLATFGALLHRYSGQSDVVVGTSIANRNWVEIEKLTGFFVNSLPLRTNFSGDPTFRELLRRVRELSLGAYAHQDLPFEKLVEELQPERGLQHQAIFQVMLILQNAPLTSLELPDLTVELLHEHNGTSKFDMLLSMIEQHGQLRGTLEYSTDLFDAATIARLLAHFQTLVVGAINEPTRRVSELPLLTDEERQQLLVAWNDTTTDYPRGACVHRLFEAQAARRPAAVAAHFEDETITYQELDSRANRLAAHLCKRGIGPGALVGVCVGRSVEMLVALLGVLKAGAAYLPLDPAHPQQRLAAILEDAQVSLLLTERELAGVLPEQTYGVVYLDADAETIAREAATPPPVHVTAEHLAYVIYTSGSTGRPKGVQIPHRALTNFLHAMLRRPGLTEHDTLLAVTTLSFDIAGLELFLPLVAGGRVVIVSHETAADPRELRRRLARFNPTIMQATPATWRMLVETGWEGSRSLKALCGGEALARELAVELVARCGELWNMYGPTETTIWSAVNKLDTPLAGVTIGSPIANTQLHVLDAALQLVPVGVPGELYIGGAGLAHGYHNQPALTADRFIPDPFSATPGARLYRTGDLVRRLPGGDIEYLERIDHQVKVRGFRIELGEIEAVIRQHAAVGAAVVVARPDAAGEKQLAAYVTPAQGGDVGTEADETAWGDEQVAQWQMAWDQTYGQAAADTDPTFNIAGWNSSYTGLPIPAEEMREWVERTVERILTLQPRRVLEIGCGTGLLLYRLAPRCAEYLGTDVSPRALRDIEAQLTRLNLPHVSLRQQKADDLSDIKQGRFDTVILNSVVQYFPGINYLAGVLAGAAQLVAPGGRIFIGDVRSYPLLKTFHAAVEFQRAADSLPLAELRRAIERHLSQEEELTIDPTFFHALKQHVPEISGVEIQVKRGSYHNELTRFRYDVILHVGDERDQARARKWLDWDEQQLTFAALRRTLCETAPETLAVARVPSTRLQTEVRLTELLAQDDALQVVADLRRALQAESESGSGVDPETLWRLGEEFGYAVDVSWSGTGAGGRYDAVFRRDRLAASSVQREQTVAGVATDERSRWQAYANDPLKGKFVREVVRQLRALIREKLPEYMMPAAFVVLDALPLTPNGKIDRNALPEPDRASASTLQANYVAPRTATEAILAGFWADVLGLERVSVNDSFFDLGGYSLLATQLVARVGESFQAEFPLRLIFESPAVSSFAQAMLRYEEHPGDFEKVAHLIKQLDDLSDEEASALLAG